MYQILLIAGVFGLMAWHYLAGAGSYGRTPYGTAVALAKAAADSDCSARVQERFPETPGARELCSASYQAAFRRFHRTVVIEESANAAEALCAYGST